MKKIVNALVGGTLAVTATLAASIPLLEAGDAGDLPATAQIVTSFDTLTSISGSITSPLDVDMYRLALPRAVLLSLSVAPTSTIDSQLFFFSSIGSGLVANDDMGLSLDAELTADLSPGVYYLGVTSWDRRPTNAANLPLFGDASGAPLMPINSGPVTGWTGSGAIGSYIINVSEIPEPETYALMCAGISVIGAVARRRRLARAKAS